MVSKVLGVLLGLLVWAGPLCAQTSPPVVNPRFNLNQFGLSGSIVSMAPVPLSPLLGWDGTYFSEPTSSTALHIGANVITFGKISYPMTDFIDTSNSYLVGDAGNSASDASFFMRSLGLGRWEVGMVGDITDGILNQSFHVKEVQGARFTGSVSGTALSVTAVAEGTLQVGYQVSAPGITSYTTITGLGTGTGGTGTYTLSNSWTVASTAMTAEQFYDRVVIWDKLVTTRYPAVDFLPVPGFDSIVRVFGTSGLPTLVIGNHNGRQYPYASGTGLFLDYDLGSDIAHIGAITANLFWRDIEIEAQNIRFSTGPVNLNYDAIVLDSQGAMNLGRAIKPAASASISNGGQVGIAAMHFHQPGDVLTALGGTGTAPTFTETATQVSRVTAINTAGTGGTTSTGTTTTTGPPLAATTITVASIAGFSNGDTIDIALAEGGYHETTINGAPSGSTITLTDAMPAPGNAGGAVYKAQTVTGTTGTGTKATFSVRIAAGGIAELLYIHGGNYTVNPTGCAGTTCNEPVTGAGLGGAPKLTIDMGAYAVSLLTAGAFTVPPLTPTATSSSGAGVGATLYILYQPGYGTVNLADSLWLNGVKTLNALGVFVPPFAQNAAGAANPNASFQGIASLSAAYNEIAVYGNYPTDPSGYAALWSSPDGRTGVYSAAGDLEIAGSATGAVVVQGGGTNSSTLKLNTEATGHQSIAIFQSAGTNKFALFRDTDNSFAGYDYANAKNFLYVGTGGALLLGETGSTGNALLGVWTIGGISAMATDAANATLPDAINKLLTGTSTGTLDRDTDQHFEIDKTPSPTNWYGNAWAGPATTFQFLQDQDLGSYQSAPAFMFDNTITGNGLIVGGASQSFWPGVESVFRKYGDGSAQGFTATGVLNGAGPSNYNEMDGYSAQVFNGGSTNAYLAGVEVGAYDSANAGSTHGKSVLHGVIGRVGKWDTTIPSSDTAKSNALMANSEGTEPVGAVLYAANTGGSGPGGGYYMGIDLSGVPITSGTAAYLPNNTHIDFASFAGVKTPVLGTDASDNLFLTSTSGYRFDFGITTAAMWAALGTAGGPAASGTAQTGIMRLRQNTDVGVLDMGVKAGAAGAWLQSTSSGDLSQQWPLLLNPNGGNTSVGGSFNLTGIASASGNDILCFNSSGGAVTYAASVVGCVPSALRLKNPEGLIDPEDALTRVIKLRSAVWRYKDTGTWGDRSYVGLYADDVENLDARCVSRDRAGKLDNYEDRCVIAYLVAAVQRQQAEIAALKAR